MSRSEEWRYMDTLRPPVYVCLRRKPSISDGVYHPMAIDGRIDKEDWEHAPWSERFVDIEGAPRKPTEYPLTRFKMMYDDEHLYIGAELVESKIWGTLHTKNSTMYHENDFEVFLNPDGSRHHYYELELNCLNTIWELLLYKPYKDGYSIENPYNLVGLRTAVYVDGITNSPQTICNKWCVEMAFPLGELVQFDSLRKRTALAGDVWRVNFSRVQYELDVVVDKESSELCYEKVPNKPEANIVWAPTGVIDIHRPEKWGFMFFSSQQELPGGESELASTMAEYLEQQIAMERILDTIYYDQREFYKLHEAFASSFAQLYPALEAFAHSDLLKKYDLSMPVITSMSERAKTHGDRHRSYVPNLDPDDDGDGGDGDPNVLLSPRAKEIQRLEASGLFKNYMASVQSTTQQWNVTHDGRLWKSVN
uniref:Carbohydrate-binding domain-containing protein n=1 Tax=Globisporangium ultimum (strain ATCC 200006 / CBS 805.95 / DAOM BR144) TaxID=431595 RepID=K3WTH1_GLOUD